MIEVYDGPHYPEKPSWYADERDGASRETAMRKSVIIIALLLAALAAPAHAQGTYPRPIGHRASPAAALTSSAASSSISSRPAARPTYHRREQARRRRETRCRLCRDATARRLHHPIAGGSELSISRSIHRMTIRGELRAAGHRNRNAVDPGCSAQSSGQDACGARRLGQGQPGHVELCDRPPQASRGRAVQIADRRRRAWRSPTRAPVKAQSP